MGQVSYSASILNKIGGFLNQHGWMMITFIYFMSMSIVIMAYPSYSLIAGFLLLALCCFACGGLLGFMLGVPGNINSETNIKINNGSAQTKIQRATNLELIADWLTKILLGAGLVEIKTIAHSALELSSRMGQSLPDSLLLREFIALFIGLGFAACGLFSGYLWSQLKYTELRDDNFEENNSEDNTSIGSAPSDTSLIDKER